MDFKIILVLITFKKSILILDDILQKTGYGHILFSLLNWNRNKINLPPIKSSTSRAWNLSVNEEKKSFVVN